MKNPQLERQLTVVETSLQERFNGISPAELCAAFADTERRRSDWLVSAVMFGLKCVAAKPQVKRGDFMDFISKAIKDKDGKSLSTARRYIGLAGKIMAQVAMPDATNEIGSRVVEYFKGAKGRKPKFESVLSTEENIREILKFLLDGLSLHGLTKMLQGADARSALEEKCANPPPREIPAGEAEIVQLSFEDELFAPIGRIQKLIKTDSFAELPKDKALEFADALIAEGMELKRRINGGK